MENANIYANTGQAIVFHDLKTGTCSTYQAMKALTSSVILGGGRSYMMDVFNINDLIYTDECKYQY